MKIVHVYFLKSATSYSIGTRSSDRLKTKEWTQFNSICIWKLNSKDARTCWYWWLLLEH